MKMKWICLSLSDSGKMDIVEYLIQRGANVNHRNKSWDWDTPLMWAVLSGNLNQMKCNRPNDILLFLIQEIRGLWNSCLTRERNPVRTARNWFRLSWMVILKCNCYYLLWKFQFQNRFSGNIEIANLLIQRGANLNHPVNIGLYTPIFFAVEDGI